MGNENTKENNLSGYGLRILGVDRESMLLHKIELYTDFITAINECRDVKNLRENGPSLETLISANKPMTLKVFNIISEQEREIQLEKNYDGSLGITQ
jgi:hypothetical protein